MGHPPEDDHLHDGSTPKPAPKRKPAKRRAPGKAAAARAEVKPEPKTVKFRGLTLTLPDTLPGTLYFDFAGLEEAGDSPAAVVRLLRSMIGEEQVQQVYAKIQDDGVAFADMEDVILGLFNAALEPYGLAVGEAQASPAS